MLLSSAVRKMAKSCSTLTKEARSFINEHGHVWVYDTLIKDKRYPRKYIADTEVAELIKMYKTLQDTGEKK
jgi:hypothetical protein